MPRLLSTSLLLVLLSACRDSAPRTAADSQAAHVAEVVAAGGTVDSILPIAEHLARFQRDIGALPDTLRGASATRDELVDRWASAVASNDTTLLNMLLIDRAEFAALYYPGSRMSLPPYEAPPELLWGQLLASSNEGIRAVLKNFGGQALNVVAIRCPVPIVDEGRNRLHEECLVTIKRGGEAPAEARLFGTIFERDGRFKFVGYANAL